MMILGQSSCDKESLRGMAGTVYFYILHQRNSMQTDLLACVLQQRTGEMGPVL